MKKAILNILIVICLVVFVYCAYQLIQYFYGNMEQEKTFDKVRDQVADITKFDERKKEYKNMEQQNEDFRGWIIADGTNINYPVVQTVDDPEFYLYRNFEKQESKPGTPFLSNVSDIDRPSDLIIVYAHNMKDGTMFGSLRRYEEKSFLDEQGIVWLDNLKERKQFQVTHVMKIRVGNKDGDNDSFPYYQYSDFKNKADFKKFIEQCNAHSIYDAGRKVEYGDKLIMLSTCEYSYEDGSGRLVVMGKQVDKPNEQQEVITPEITKPMMGTYVMIGIGVLALIIVLVLLTSLIRRIRKK